MTAFDYLDPQNIKSVYDKIDLIICASLFALVLFYGGNRRRWIETVSLLAFHLVAARYCIHAFDNPVQPLAFIHAALAFVFLAFSQSNYGRGIGVCFLAMIGLDGLAIDGILSPEIKQGLHFNYWNYVSSLQHVQAAIAGVCFWKYRRTSWAMV